MGNMKEIMGEGLGKENVAIRYASMNSNGIWGEGLGVEGEKGDRGNT